MDERKWLGRQGEAAARRFLLGQGWTVVAANHRCRLGEIDVLALDGDTLVFCEVKTRTSDSFGPPAAAVDRRKCARLRRLAEYFVACEMPLRPWHQMRQKVRDFRIDVIAVTFGDAPAPEIDHLKGVV